jgi:DNA-binding Lrp family transcriptional regulator
VLSRNARVANVEIAEETGISAMHVSRLIASLEERGIIAGYRPIVDFEALGFQYVKLFVNLRHKGGSDEKLLADLRKTPEVIYTVHGVAMPGDLDIEILLDGSDSVAAFMERLQNRHKGVIMNYEYLSYSQLLKVNYFPF